LGLCGGASFSWEVQYGGQACFAEAPNRSAAVTVTKYHGASVPGIGVDVEDLTSNAQSVTELGGPFHYAEGSVGKFEYSAGGTYSWGGHNISVWTGGWTPSLSVSKLFSVGYGTSDTEVFQPF
jgi:hypothetical protein